MMKSFKQLFTKAKVAATSLAFFPMLAMAEIPKWKGPTTGENISSPLEWLRALLAQGTSLGAYAIAAGSLLVFLVYAGWGIIECVRGKEEWSGFFRNIVIGLGVLVLVFSVAAVVETIWE